MQPDADTDAEACWEEVDELDRCVFDSFFEESEHD